MKIKKGKEYECIKDVVMDTSGTVEFTKGKIYKATHDNQFTDDSNDPHGTGSAKFAKKHFKKVKKKKFIYFAAFSRGSEDNASFIQKVGIHSVSRFCKWLDEKYKKLDKEHGDGFVLTSIKVIKE